jgi:hypothetical protein
MKRTLTQMPHFVAANTTLVDMMFTLDINAIWKFENKKNSP